MCCFCFSVTKNHLLAIRTKPLWFDGVFNKKRPAKVTNHNRGSNAIGIYSPYLMRASANPAALTFLSIVSALVLTLNAPT